MIFFFVLPLSHFTHFLHKTLILKTFVEGEKPLLKTPSIWIVIYMFKACWCACPSLFSSEIDNIVNCSVVHHPFISQIPDQNWASNIKGFENIWVIFRVTVSISSDQVSVFKYQFHLKWFRASWRNNWFWIKFWENLWISYCAGRQRDIQNLLNMSRKLTTELRGLTLVV